MTDGPDHTRLHGSAGCAARARRLGPGSPEAPPQRRSRLLALLVIVGALQVIGLVMVLSASSVISLRDYGSSWYHFNRQAAWAGVSLVALVVLSRIDYRAFRRLSTPLLVAAIALLLLVLVPGVGISVNGASRWLGVGPLRFQPSELAKLALVVWAADLLTRRSQLLGDSRATIGPVVIVVGLVAVPIVLEPDLGTAIIIGAIGTSVLYAAGVRLLPLVGLASLGAAATVALTMMRSYRRARLLAFLDPWADPLNTGYQTIQSLVGIASGGVTGVGVGASRTKWGFLPFAHTDFIFAIIAEELGLIGAVTVVMLFVAFGFVGFAIAMHSPDRFGMLLAAGITAWILTQAFVNIGAATGLLPITGVPLPFLSAGGTSLVVAMAAAGVLVNIARQSR